MSLWSASSLPLRPPVAPMEARLSEQLPSGGGWLYEPKWDGFRCLAFREEDALALQSKSGQPLERYFPEVTAALARSAARRFVLDGELVVANGSFDDLLQRIHPARSRIERLARVTPATMRLFDLLVDERGRELARLPLEQRRERLVAFYERRLGGLPGIELSPATTDVRVARRWLSGRGGTDGVMAKAAREPYHPGDRDAMVKVKRLRTADCVVGGFRYAASGGGLGSLLLGLYGADGALHHVGFAAALDRPRRAEALSKVEALRGGAGFTGRAPGGPSRWASERSGDWIAVEPRLVVEVRFDHVTAGRFRHGARFLRWRPDKDPRSCTFEQLEGL